MVWRENSSWRRAVCATACSIVIACGGDSPTSPSPTPQPSPSPAPGGQASVVLTEDFGGRQLFPSDNGWNQDITNAPIDPQSAAFISADTRFLMPRRRIRITSREAFPAAARAATGIC